ncbi:ANR family transcriptional regulator [Serratia marcescens]
MEQAALLEREACFEDAAHYWLASLELAEKWNIRHWCEARASLCQKRTIT